MFVTTVVSVMIVAFVTIAVLETTAAITQRINISITAVSTIVGEMIGDVSTVMTSILFVSVTEASFV